MKKIIVTGITGQDGSYMVDFLLKNTEDYIIGGIRRLSVKNHKNIEHFLNHPRFKLIDLDIADQANVDEVIREWKPDYFINFAANSFVGNSWVMPVNHMNTNCMAVLYQLEAIRKYAPECRYYNAGSSEEFGDVLTVPQGEDHPLRPRSPYGVSKCAARHMVKVYRESYNLFAIQGWLFNHESERRGEEFVTQKICKNVIRIRRALDQCTESIIPLELGNLSAKRDWSHAEDMVEGVWLMLNSDKPKEYVLASGETHTVREFVEMAFDLVGIEGKWQGEGLETEFIDPKTNIVLVKINKEFYRPAEVELLLGDPYKAQKELGWQKKVDFPTLVRRMLENEVKEKNAT
jgi:GDPmannose 4,6-dehydratase